MGSRDDEQQTGGITVTAWQRSLATRFPRRVDSAGTSVGGYDVSASTMAVGLMLATFADYDTGRSAHPSAQTLAALTGRNERTVRQALADLAAHGVIRKVGVTGGRYSGIPIWDLTPGVSPGVPDVTPGVSPGVPDVTPGVSPVTPGVSPVTPGVSSADPGCITRQPSLTVPYPPPPGPPESSVQSDGPADHGGGGVDDILHKLNSGLPTGLQLTPTAPVLASIDSALARGWDPDELRARAAANLDGIRSPGAIARRLATLARTSPPAPSSSAGRQWHQDPQLLRRVASRLLAEPQHLGRVLDRLADDDFDVALVELVAESAVSIAVTHPTIPNPGAWSVGWTVQSDGRTTCMAAMDVGADEVALLPQHGFELEADGTGVSSRSGVAAFDALVRSTFTVAAHHYGEQLAVVA